MEDDAAAADSGAAMATTSAIDAIVLRTIYKGMIQHERGSTYRTRGDGTGHVPLGETRATFPPEPTRSAPHALARRSRLRNAPGGPDLEGCANVHAILATFKLVGSWKKEAA